jgi:hypothetical protein
VNTADEATLLLEDVRHLFGATRAGNAIEQDIMVADPTDGRALDRIVARLAAVGAPAATRNTVLRLQYQILQQREANTVAALGGQRGMSPTRSDTLPNRGGASDTASDYSDHPNRLKAMDRGELRKRLDMVEPVYKADGTIDAVATATKILLKYGGQVVASSRHPRGGR